MPIRSQVATSCATQFFRHHRHVRHWLLPTCLAIVSATCASAQNHDVPEGRTPSRTLLIDFVGGFVHSDDTRHPEVQIVHHFQEKPVPGVEAVVFENTQTGPAEERIIQFLDENKDGIISTDEKQRAQLILLGHSWGGGAVMKVAEDLNRRNIPVTLMIQVDGVGKFAPRSCLVPPNVREAMNFYQTKLPIRGCQDFRAVDPTKTTILANVRLQYDHQPPECHALPWRDRVFLRSHNSLGCDPHVWSEVEKQIDATLGTTSIASSSK